MDIVLELIVILFSIATVLELNSMSPGLSLSVCMATEPVFEAVQGGLQHRASCFFMIKLWQKGPPCTYSTFILRLNRALKKFHDSTEANFDFLHKVSQV